MQELHEWTQGYIVIYQVGGLVEWWFISRHSSYLKLAL